MMLHSLPSPFYPQNNILFTLICITTKKLTLTNFETPYHLFHGKSSDIDSWWENWKGLFLAAVSTDIPSCCGSKMKCWLSLAAIKAIKQKHIVCRKLKRKPSDCLAHKYKSLRNLVRKLTRKDYQIYAEKVSSSLGSDQKVFWNWVNKVKCCRHPVPPI